MVTLSVSSILWTLTINILGGLIASAIWSAVTTHRKTADQSLQAHRLCSRAPA